MTGNIKAEIQLTEAAEKLIASGYTAAQVKNLVQKVVSGVYATKQYEHMYRKQSRRELL